LISVSEFKAIEAGDLVRIVERWNENTIEASTGEMDKYLGQVIQVSFVREPNSYNRVCVYDSSGDCHIEHWVFNRYMIDEVFPQSIDDSLTELSIDPATAVEFLLGGLNVQSISET